MSSLRGRIPSCDEQMVHQMRQMRATGATYREIGQRFDVSARTAHRYVTGASRPNSATPSTEYDDLAYTGDWVRHGLILRPECAS